MNFQTSKTVNKNNFDLIKLSRKKSKKATTDEQQFLESISLTKSNKSKRSNKTKSVSNEQLEKQQQSPSFSAKINRPTISIYNNNTNTSNKIIQNKNLKNPPLIPVQQETQSDMNSSSQFKQVKNNQLKNIKISNNTNLTQFDTPSLKNINIKKSSLTLTQKVHQSNQSLQNQQDQSVNQIQKQQNTDKQKYLPKKYNFDIIHLKDKKQTRKSMTSTPRPRGKTQLSQQPQILNDIISNDDVINHYLYKKLQSQKIDLKQKYQIVIKEMEDQLQILEKQFGLKEKKHNQQNYNQKKERQFLHKQLNNLAEENLRLKKQNEILNKNLDHFICLSKSLTNMTSIGDDSQQNQLLSNDKPFYGSTFHLKQTMGLDIQTQNFKLKRKLILYKTQLDEIEQKYKQFEQQVDILKSQKEGLIQKYTNTLRIVNFVQNQNKKIKEQLEEAKNTSKNKLLLFQNQINKLKSGIYQPIKQQKNISQQVKKVSSNQVLAKAEKFLSNQKIQKQIKLNKNHKKVLSNLKDKTREQKISQYFTERNKHASPSNKQKKEDFPFKIAQENRSKDKLSINYSNENKLQALNRLKIKDFNQFQDKKYLNNHQRKLERKQSIVSIQSNQNSHKNNYAYINSEKLLNKKSYRNKFDKFDQKHIYQRSKSPKNQYMLTDRFKKYQDQNIQRPHQLIKANPYLQMQYSLKHQKIYQKTQANKPIQLIERHYKIVDSNKRISKGQNNLQQKLEKLKKEMTNQLAYVKNIDKNKQYNYHK